MPIIHANIVRGRSQEQIRRLLQKLVEVTSDSLNVPTASVRVLVHEVEAENWAVGDQTYAEREAGQAR